MSINRGSRCSLFAISGILTAVIIGFTLIWVSLASAAPKIPEVALSVVPLDLSRPPATEEIMAAGQLGGQLYPAGEIEFSDVNSETLEYNQKINLSFGEAIQEWNKHGYKDAVNLFKKHIEEYPDSPWASEAVLHVGYEAHNSERYTEAEECFNWVLQNNAGKDYEGAKRLINKAKLHLGVLKVNQNNFEAAKELFRDLKQKGSDWSDRTYAIHWLQRLARYTADETAMLNCGTQAVAYILEKNGKKTQAGEVSALRPETTRGHNLKVLTDIALKYGYPLSAIKVSGSEIKELPLPAIMYINGKNKGDRGHYWVLEKINNDSLELFDPQAGRRFNQSVKEFSREWSGVALALSNKEKLPGITLSENEMAQVYGGCCCTAMPADDMGEPGNNGWSGVSGAGSGCGAPAWQVNMVNMNFYVKDTPLWYKCSVGPSVAITLSYNSQSIYSNDHFGNKWQFNYGSYLTVDPNGNVTIHMPDGRSDIYTRFCKQACNGCCVYGYTPPYQVFNDLSKLGENHYELKLPDGTVYVYDIPSGTTSQQPYLVKIIDAHGQYIYLSYNSDVRLTTITDAIGSRTTLTYTNGRVTQVTGPSGRFATFEYDANNNLTEITDMGGYWTSLAYDDSSFITSITNARGTWGFYTEPADGIPNNNNPYPVPGGAMYEDYRITVTNPLGRKEEYYYNQACHGCGWYVSPKYYIEFIDNFNNYTLNRPKTTFNYIKLSGDNRGEISKITYPEGDYVSFGYDSNGNRTSVTDAYGTVSYTYNSKGRITSITDAKITTTTLTYASNGVDLLSIQNSGLGTISATYNNYHQVTSLTDRLNNTTSFDYNGYGQLWTMTNALNQVTNYVYSMDHRLQKAYRNDATSGVLGRFTYDSIGRVHSYTDATGSTLVFSHNNLNNITRITYPDGKYIKYTYSDCCPNLLGSVTDRGGRTTSYTYDSLKRLTEIVNPEDGLTELVYDANSNIFKLTDANGNITTFIYNKNNRPVRKTYANGTSVSLTYNNNGLPSSYTNARGVMTTYTYDINHNLTSINYSDSTPDVSYQYDNYNRVTQRTDGMGTYRYSYNANSWLTSINGPWANDNLTFQYDALGQLTGLTPQGGQAVSYTYDYFNRLTDVTRGGNNHSYSYVNANPLVQNLTRPNGSITDYDFDNLNRLTGISNRNSSSQIINQYLYSYNQQDMRSKEAITNNQSTYPGSGQVSYSYNQVNQLTNATGQTFSYDVDGNMTQGYTPEGYQFTADYDAENRLYSLKYTASGVVNKTKYYYSGDGFLAQKKVYQNSTLVSDIRYVQAGYLPIQERNGSNSVTREYTWGLNLGGGIGGLLNLNQGGQDYAYLYDGKGNVTGLLNSSQSLAAAYTYDSFGNPLAKTGTLNQPFRFSTKLYDEKTGMAYYGYRFYSPIIGRWVNRDPIGELGGINLYEFVGSVGKPLASRILEMNLYQFNANNPVNYVDPWGLWSVSIEAYVGPGGGIVFGENPGGGFFASLRGGYGKGGGVSYNPEGSSPGWSPCGDHSVTNIGAGMYGEASVALGPFYRGISGNAGTILNWGHYYNPSKERGLDLGWSLRGGYAGGIEIFIF